MGGPWGGCVFVCDAGGEILGGRQAHHASAHLCAWIVTVTGRGRGRGSVIGTVIASVTASPPPGKSHPSLNRMPRYSCVVSQQDGAPAATWNQSMCVCGSCAGCGGLADAFADHNVRDPPPCRRDRERGDRDRDRDRDEKRRREVEEGEVRDDRGPRDRDRERDGRKRDRDY